MRDILRISGRCAVRGGTIDFVEHGLGKLVLHNADGYVDVAEVR